MKKGRNKKQKKIKNKKKIKIKKIKNKKSKNKKKIKKIKNKKSKNKKKIKKIKNKNKKTGPSWMKESGRKRVVVLGSGWAAYRIMRDLDIDKYDLTVVSPRFEF